MDYPIYDIKILNEITCNIGEDADACGFDGFINDLIYYQLLNTPEEEEVAYFVHDHGTILLDESQHKILATLIERFPTRCKTCKSEYEFYLRAGLMLNDGSCLLCVNRANQESIKPILNQSLKT